MLVGADRCGVIKTTVGRHASTSGLRRDVTYGFDHDV